MSLSESDKHLITTVSELTVCNPFLPRRFELEKELLGDGYHSMGRVWSFQREHDLRNIEAIFELTKARIDDVYEYYKSGKFNEKEWTVYVKFVLYYLYDKYADDLNEYTIRVESSEGNPIIQCFEQFRSDFVHYLGIVKANFKWLVPGHIIAIFLQLRRAFYAIFNYIWGSSMPIAQLRAAIWESIFTHDMFRYFSTLYKCMGDINTLITGPSGTGKEIVARAIAKSRYVPFDKKSRCLKENYNNSYHALNLSALSPTLIESELFGHCKGAFTGATHNRKGWLEVCSQYGTIFLDEIGEVEESIQVKLLRVLQTRQFQSLGETNSKNFKGKIIAATNRDLQEEIREGRFRQDFYYRLCSDVIQTPSLNEQLIDQPDDIFNLIYLLVGRIVGDDVEEFSHDIQTAITRSVGKDYNWPGNVRELEQCVRNIIVRGSYKVHSIKAQNGLMDALTNADLTVDELITFYCSLLYEKHENYQKISRMINLDRRTVKSKVNLEILDRFKPE